MKHKPISPKCSVDRRAISNAYQHLLSEVVIIIHVCFHLNPGKIHKLSILPGSLNMVRMRRSVKMIHAEGIYVAANCMDRKGTVVKDRLVHHCVLYFEKMPLSQDLFSLILHQPGGDSYVKHHMKRTHNDVYRVDFFEE
jgi:hypothetical protein